MIDEGQAFAYFDAVHGPLRPSTHGWYDGVCPLCADMKLAVTFEYNLVKCWKGCFDRQFIIDFIIDIEGVRRFEAYEILESYEGKPLDYTYIKGQVEVSEVALPAGYQGLLRGEGVIGDRARSYLSGRGFNLGHLDNLGLGYCNEEHEDPQKNFFGYIIIPLKSRGKLCYFLARDFMGNFPRYKNPPKDWFGVGKSQFLFNEEALYMYDSIYLTEGWTDSATMGPQGVSYQGLDLSKYQSSTILESPVNEIIIVPDIGAYKEGLKQAQKLYEHKKVKVVDLSQLNTKGKDINEIGKRSVEYQTNKTEYLSWARLYKGLRHE
ncbi:hypothetical protein LCGC14_0278660 [marine sediment metagenome]|uniref:Toprim domain-containing protein n=1 Tax=marine sediment metagenome TaxID=412755 RepID=A0A0F9X268_9ZZZZ